MFSKFECRLYYSHFNDDNMIIHDFKLYLKIIYLKMLYNRINCRTKFWFCPGKKKQIYIFLIHSFIQNTHPHFSILKIISLCKGSLYRIYERTHKNISCGFSCLLVYNFGFLLNLCIKYMFVNYRFIDLTHIYHRHFNI